MVRYILQHLIGGGHFFEKKGVEMFQNYIRFSRKHLERNLIRVTPVWRFNLITSDPDDNKFVDCAICGQAEYLVSNDKHFKVLNDIQFPSITLVTLQEYITR